MSVDATSQERRAASATTDPARIRELLLANLFAVFSERDPERRLQVIERNYTEDVIWSDPDRTTHGHEEMNEQAQKLLDRSTSACRSSRPRSAGSTWRWWAMDGSPACTRS